MRAAEHTVLCLFVCLSVCSSHIRSAGGIQAKVDAFKRIIPSFLGLGFADLQNRTLFSSYDNICSPGRPRKAPTTPSRENLLMLACLIKLSNANRSWQTKVKAAKLMLRLVK